MRLIWRKKSDTPWAAAASTRRSTVGRLGSGRCTRWRIGNTGLWATGSSSQSASVIARSRDGSASGVSTGSTEVRTPSGRRSVVQRGSWLAAVLACERGRGAQPRECGGPLGPRRRSRRHRRHRRTRKSRSEPTARDLTPSQQARPSRGSPFTTASRSPASPARSSTTRKSSTSGDWSRPGRRRTGSSYCGWARSSGFASAATGAEPYALSACC